MIFPLLVASCTSMKIVHIDQGRLFTDGVEIESWDKTVIIKPNEPFPISSIPDRAVVALKEDDMWASQENYMLGLLTIDLKTKSSLPGFFHNLSKFFEIGKALKVRINIQGTDKVLYGALMIVEEWLWFPSSSKFFPKAEKQLNIYIPKKVIAQLLRINPSDLPEIIDPSPPPSLNYLLKKDKAVLYEVVSIYSDKMLGQNFHSEYTTWMLWLSRSPLVF